MYYVNANLLRTISRTNFCRDNSGYIYGGFQLSDKMEIYHKQLEWLDGKLYSSN
jgi:hypothetical protein